MAKELEAIVVGELVAVDTGKPNPTTGEVPFIGRVLSPSKRTVAAIKGFTAEMVAKIGQQVQIPVMIRAGEWELYPTMMPGASVGGK